MSIRILENTPNMWYFVSDDAFFNVYSKCSKCDFPLDVIYSYIISKLKKSNLLPENYEPMCCMCNKIKNTLEHCKCNLCKAYIDFEYFPLEKRSYRVVCNTKGCKFKKRMFTL